MVELSDAILAKPRFRGVSHQWAFFIALVAGAVLVAAAPSGRATLAAAIYALSVVAMFGASALYHRVNWKSVSARRWMRRLDHSMIYVLIAGGGVLYTLGAIVYSLRRPDPAPAVFGYHEIFHVLVIAAAVLQYVAVAAYALPEG